MEVGQSHPERARDADGVGCLGPVVRIGGAREGREEEKCQHGDEAGKHVSPPKQRLCLREILDRARETARALTTFESVQSAWPRGIAVSVRPPRPQFG